MTESHEKIEVENQSLSEEAKAAPEEVHEKVEERGIPRRHVTDIVKRERQDAYQKGKRDAMLELQEQQAAPVSQAPAQMQAPSNNVGMGGISQITPEQISQMIAAEAQKLEEKRKAEDVKTQQNQYAHTIAQQFNSQMLNGKAKRPDFDEKVKDLDFNNMAEIVHLASETGIADEIMYDLASNPQKITHLMILAHSQPKLARAEMQKLAGSIKTNESALAQAHRSPREPLDQITPSSIGADSGEMSVADYMKIFI